MSKKAIYHYMYEDSGSAGTSEAAAASGGSGTAAVADLRQVVEKLTEGVMRLFTPMNSGMPVELNAMEVDGIRANFDFWSVGAISALSDARRKEIVDNVHLSVEQIAKMRAVRFKWKDREDERLHAGAIAQEWQKILPEVVHETKDGTLTLDYGAAALICVIKIAQELAASPIHLQKERGIKRWWKRLKKVFK